MNKLTNTQIAIIHAILHRFSEENKKGTILFNEMEVCTSDYTDEVFIRYIRLYMGTDQNAAKSNECIGISTTGQIEYEVYKNRKFKDLSDKVHFFDKLQKIEL